MLAIEAFDSIYTFYKSQIKEGTTLARGWVRGVDFGGVDLEQLLFADEIQEEKIEIAQKAAEKIKLAVDAVLRLKGSGNLDAIQIIKIQGGTLDDSFLDEGKI